MSHSHRPDIAPKTRSEYVRCWASRMKGELHPYLLRTALARGTVKGTFIHVHDRIE